MILGDGAFPLAISYTKPDENSDLGFKLHMDVSVGLTKRELLTAMILQGYVSSGRKETVINSKNVSLAKASVILADELLKELNNG
jgi:hypothetical protein